MLENDGKRYGSIVGELGGRWRSGKRIWGSSPLRFINTTRGPPATTHSPKLDHDFDDDNDDHDDHDDHDDRDND